MEWLTAAGSGRRVDSGGFHSMATKADGSVNRAGIDTFADSAVAFVKKYGFSGVFVKKYGFSSVDIDCAHPTAMRAGRPDRGGPETGALPDPPRARLRATGPGRPPPSVRPPGSGAETP